MTAAANRKLLVIAAVLGLTIGSANGQQSADPTPIRIWGHGALGHDYIESLVRKWEVGFSQNAPRSQVRQ